METHKQPKLQAGSTAISHALPSPLQLREQLPLSLGLAAQVEYHRQAIRSILNGEDNRLLVVVGPCSIHDPQAALEYAERLAAMAERVGDKMLLVMRMYIEKPRTTLGWKGLLYDPHLDGSNDMRTGLELSRSLMLKAVEMGLPIATELLQPLAVHYFADVLGWAAIGARTSESQVHREMVSGLDFPVGFKNGTDGGVQVALDAMHSAAHGHQYMGVDSSGNLALLQAGGNPDTHLVLRGGSQGTNYDAQSVQAAVEAMQKSGLRPAIMVDCNHGNSGKDPLRQPAILQDIAQQRRDGNRHLCAVMIESHLGEGNQSLGAGMQYGVSVTDACLGWERTEQSLLHLAAQL